MQARWVIAGMFAVTGAYWLVTLTLLALGVDAAWQPYGVCVVAAFGAGALMVAHAPLRPWREPAVAGVLGIAVVAALVAVGPDIEVTRFIARAVRPWYAALGVVAVGGAMAAAGGLAVRRIATATPRTDLILLLSTLVATGAIAVVAMVADESVAGTLAGLGSMVAGGFITQTVIAARRPWTCGAGTVVLVLFALGAEDLTGNVFAILITIIGGLILLTIGYGGARLAWWALRRDDEPPAPDLPPARLG